MTKPSKLAKSKSLVIVLLLIAVMLNSSILLAVQPAIQTSTVEIFSIAFPKLQVFSVSLIVLILAAVICVWFIYRLSSGLKITSEKHGELYLTDLAVKASSNGVAIADSQRNLIFVNPAFENITGYQSGEVAGKNPNILASGRHDNAFYKQMWQSIQRHGRWEGEIWNRRKNGELYLEWINIIKISDSLLTSGAYLAVFSDITQRKEQENIQTFKANHDPLTQLPNRNMLFEKIEQALSDSAKNKTNITLLFLDLDRFKAINDTHGHLIGDEILVSVAERLKHDIRKTDLVCRYGGDEFIVLLLDTEPSEYWQNTVDKLLVNLSQPYNVRDKIFKLTVSIGVATHYGDDPVSVTEFIHKADEAMYQAKMTGRNKFAVAQQQSLAS